MKTKFPLLIVVIGIMCLCGTSLAKDHSAHKSQVLIVDLFTVQEGVDFPLDYLATMQEEVMTHIQKKNIFKEVLRPGEKPSDSAAQQVRLGGVVTQFQPGSRIKRYVLGPGFGKTKIVAQIRFTDGTSGNVLYEKTVDGKVIIGFIGGESIGATRGLAKEVASDAEKSY
jgi:hypothetical protein